MSDSLETIWNAEPHTIAKHAILKKYLDAWFPILSSQANQLQEKYGNSLKREILFVDAFAGPGKYKRGEPGSPLIALRAAMQHSLRFPIPVRLLFIEKDKDRFDHLKQIIQLEMASYQGENNVIVDEPKNGDCDPILSEIIQQHTNRGSIFGPALAFLDQFGYSSVSMELISDIMMFPQCEVLTYLDAKGMNRWIQHPVKRKAFYKAFGGNEWEHAINLPERQQSNFLLEKYLEALKSRGNSKYVFPFAMLDKNNRLLYWLIFCTGSLDGLERMKYAMWSVDKNGGCRFSDSDRPGQLLLGEKFDPEWLAQELLSKLAGKKLTVAEIREFVLTETPCYLFRDALKKIESDKANNGISIISSSVGRKPGTFPKEELEKILIEFRAGHLF